MLSADRASATCQMICFLANISCMMFTGYSFATNNLSRSPAGTHHPPHPPSLFCCWQFHVFRAEPRMPSCKWCMESSAAAAAAADEQCLTCHLAALLGVQLECAAAPSLDMLSSSSSGTAHLGPRGQAAVHTAGQHLDGQLHDQQCSRHPLDNRGAPEQAQQHSMPFGQARGQAANTTNGAWLIWHLRCTWCTWWTCHSTWWHSFQQQGVSSAGPLFNALHNLLHTSPCMCLLQYYSLLDSLTTVEEGQLLWWL
jgi:hypothetical protein